MNKNLAIFAAILVISIGLVSAAWAVGYFGSAEGELKGIGKKVDVIIDMDNFVMDEFFNELMNVQNISLDNQKDAENVTVTFDVNKTLTEMACPDFENDCSVEFFNATNFSYYTGLQTIFPAGISNYTLVTSCVENFCGQNISVVISMQ